MKPPSSTDSVNDWKTASSPIADTSTPPIVASSRRRRSSSPAAPIVSTSIHLRRFLGVLSGSTVGAAAPEEEAAAAAAAASFSRNAFGETLFAAGTQKGPGMPPRSALESCGRESSEVMRILLRSRLPRRRVTRVG